MAKSVVINGVTYANTPEVDIPISGGGTAKFYETSTGDAWRQEHDKAKLDHFFLRRSKLGSSVD